jgi:hypothetical protein
MKTTCILILTAGILFGCSPQKSIHPFEIHEIVLEAQNDYENPYREVECWVQLKGPEFNKRVYGFWDGNSTFKVRIAGTAAGEWDWESGSNQPDDAGLNGHKGSFTIIPWTEEEKLENPNRRGHIRSSADGHSLEYADGTPFFFIGDTWWASSTWRYPLTGNAPDQNWEPGPEGHSFENVVNYRKNQGFNMVAMIACYPNWAADEYPAVIVDSNGIGIRQPWEKFGTPTAKDMHDESGNRPFALYNGGPMTDFDQINPEYFKSLDKKIDYLNSAGFVPFLETVRRDHGPSWKAYFDWPGSFVRYIQYIAARYGAYNMIFSPVHLDWIPPVHSLSGEEFNAAIVEWYYQYGPLPYNLPVTSLIDGATHVTYGAGEKVPWLTMHSVGNSPRNHGFYPWLEEQFRLDPPKPAANLEPYYPGWNQYDVSIVAGEKAERNSERDNYFGRTQAWGSVLSGGLSGHIYGTGAYDGTTVGEPAGVRPYIWEALKFPAGKQVGFVRKFLMSEGTAYTRLQLTPENITPRKSGGSLPDGLDGWAFMMTLPDKEMAMLYFENRCEAPKIAGLAPERNYALHWFDPITGEWLETLSPIKTDEQGVIILTSFPDGNKISDRDWALKIKIE